MNLIIKLTKNVNIITKIKKKNNNNFKLVIISQLIEVAEKKNISLEKMRGKILYRPSFIYS